MKARVENKNRKSQEDGEVDGPFFLDRNCGQLYQEFLEVFSEIGDEEPETEVKDLFQAQFLKDVKEEVRLMKEQRRLNPDFLSDCAYSCDVLVPTISNVNMTDSSAEMRPFEPIPWNIDPLSYMSLVPCLFDNAKDFPPSPTLLRIIPTSIDLPSNVGRVVKTKGAKII